LAKTSSAANSPAEFVTSKLVDGNKGVSFQMLSSASSMLTILNALALALDILSSFSVSTLSKQPIVMLCFSAIHTDFSLNLYKMTPQKVFMDNIHLWILPVILVVIKLFFDLLPTPFFFGSILLVIGGYYAYNRFKVNQSERTAKQLEDSADTFLSELNRDDKIKKEKKKVILLYGHFSSTTFYHLSLYASDLK